MPLPKLNIPLFDVVLPSNDKLIRCRPFLVEEEELLLIVQEGLSGPEEEQKKEVVDAICQILENCIQEPKVDVRSLPIFDIEYAFIQLRSKSIGDKIDLFIKGIEKTDCAKCKENKKIVWDLTTVKVTKPEGHEKKIKLTDDIGITMKYPTLGLLDKLVNIKMGKDFTKVVAKCVESIYDSDRVYSARDVTEEEIVTFLRGMTKKQFSKIKLFFDTCPKIEHELTWKCPECQHEQVYILTGADNFFG